MTSAVVLRKDTSEWSWGEEASCVCALNVSTKTVTFQLRSNHGYAGPVGYQYEHGMKLNDWGFWPPLCTYKLNWARITSWEWSDEWNYTAIQTWDLEFEPWRSEGEHATSRSRRLPTILNHHVWTGKKHVVSLKLEGQSEARGRDFRLSMLVA